VHQLKSRKIESLRQDYRQDLNIFFVVLCNFFRLMSTSQFLKKLPVFLSVKIQFVGVAKAWRQR
jgi:hypothetical protein